MADFERLNKELLENPLLWRLALRIEKTAMHVVLYNNVEDNSLIYHKINLDSAASSHLKAMEDAVYENPLLLCDFARIDCVVDTDTFMLVPDGISSIEAHEKIVSVAYSEFDGEVICNEVAPQQARILMGIEHDTVNFLRRTFNNPHLHHHLSPLSRYFFHKSRSGNSAKMYAIFRTGKMDLLAFSGGSLVLANTFRLRDPMDAVYYILSCRQSLDLKPETDELFISGGSPSVREQVSVTLRQYISYVMPVIFPSAMFRAGKEAMKAPFDLIVLPLCE